MKYETPELASERLILRRGTADDFKAVYEYDFRYLRDICGEFEFVKQKEGAIDGFETYADEDDVLNWVIFLKDGDVPIGDLIADRIDPDANTIELSYNLHPTYWGNGYMPEACRCAIEYLFTLGFEGIVCGYDEGNVKSKRTIEKLGFEYAATKKAAWVKNGVPIDTHVYVLRKKQH